MATANHTSSAASQDDPFADQTAHRRAQLRQKYGLPDRISGLRVPLLGVRDSGSAWSPIRHPFATLSDPTQAIWPYKWITHPRNPEVLLNPGLCAKDPLKGACLPKQDAWLLKTRYGGDEAVKWRHFELRDKRDFHRSQSFKDWENGYVYEEGCATPFQTRPRPYLYIQPADLDLFTGKTLEHDNRASIVANKNQTGYALGDAIVADCYSRKRKADNPEPDLDHTGVSRYRCAQAQSQRGSTVKGTRHDRGVARPRTVGRTFDAINVRLKRLTQLQTTRSMLYAVGLTASWSYRTMKSVTGFVTSGLRSLVGFVSRPQTAHAAVEDRAIDSVTQNVTCKRRKLSPSADAPRPEWISELDRSRLWIRMYRLRGALMHTHASITKALFPSAPSVNGPQFSDQWKHLQLEDFHSCLELLSNASDLLEIFYGAPFLNALKERFQVPTQAMDYAPNSQDVQKMQAALHLLSDYPPILWPIIEAFGSTKEDMEAVCVDLRALFHGSPMPSFVKGLDFVSTARDKEDGSPAVSTSMDVKLQGTVIPGPTILHADNPDYPPMPGGFPRQGIEAGQPELDKSQALAPAKNPAQESSSALQARPLPLDHETLPIEVIKRHLIPPEFVENYGKKGKLAPTRHRQSHSAQGIMLSPLARPDPQTTASPSLLRKIAHRKRKTVKWDAVINARQHVSSDSYYWSYPPNNSTFNVEDRPELDFEMAANLSPTNSSTNNDHDDATPVRKLSFSHQSVIQTSPSIRSFRHYRLTDEPLPPINRHIANPIANDGESSPTAASTETSSRSSDLRQSNSPSQFGNGSSSDGQVVSQDADDHTTTNKIRQEESSDDQTNDDEASDEANDSGVTRSTAIDQERIVMARVQESVIAKWLPKPSKALFDDDDSAAQFASLKISDEKQGELADHGASLQIAVDQEQHEERERQRIAAEEARKREEEEKLQRTGGLRTPRDTLVAALSDEWAERVKSTVGNSGAEFTVTLGGTPLRGRDFERVVPATEWLNDEIVNGSLEWLDNYINTAAGCPDTRSPNRQVLCLTSFLWTRIAGGHDTDRVLRRFGISNADAFLNLETLLVPICEHSHWTLMVIRPRKRTIAHMDSLNPNGSQHYIRLAKAWLQKTCKDKWDEHAWTVTRHEAPLQTNGYDCGVHTITNGMCVALGLNPIDCYTSHDMPLQRLRIGGMLLNKGFTNDFDLSNI